MTQRSKQERARIIDRCLDIEAEGGDVLGYLREEHYVTPRATWMNIQKFDLHRDTALITSGKPTGKAVKRQRTPAAVADALADDGSPRQEPENLRQRSRRIRETVLEMLEAGKEDEARMFLQGEGVKQVNTLICTVRRESGLPPAKRGPKPKKAKKAEPREVVEKSRDLTKNDAETAKVMKFVPIRDIEGELEKEFLRLIEKAHVMPIGASMELIQEEMYVTLLKLHAIREVKNLGRKALKKEAG